MPALTDRDITRIDLEGRFQALKAKALERKTAAPTSEMAPTSLLSDQLKTLIADARTHRIGDIETRASAFLLLLEAIRLQADMAKLRAEFAQAAAIAQGVVKAKQIAADGAKGLVFVEVDKGLAKLFDALTTLKSGLDALSSVGVGGEDFDKIRDDLEKAIEAAKDKAKGKEK